MKLITLLLGVYVILVTAMVAVLLKVRANTLATMTNPQAQADWDEWKTAAAKDTGETTPVRRSAPNTTEPPKLVLMRDHFVAVLFGLLAPVTALYAFTAWMVTGVIRQSRTSAVGGASREH